MSPYSLMKPPRHIERSYFIEFLSLTKLNCLAVVICTNRFIDFIRSNTHNVALRLIGAMGSHGLTGPGRLMGPSGHMRLEGVIGHDGLLRRDGLIGAS